MKPQGVVIGHLEGSDREGGHGIRSSDSSSRRSPTARPQRPRRCARGAPCRSHPWWSNWPSMSCVMVQRPFRSSCDKHTQSALSRHSTRMLT